MNAADPFATEHGLPRFQHAQEVAGILVPAARLNRFVELLKPVDGHWIFQGPITHNGYGSFGIGGRKGTNVRAHRMAYELWVKKPTEGLMVLHECDRRTCCAPNCLYEGTAKRNTEDMIARGRQRSGAYPDMNRRVFEQDAKELRGLRQEGYTLEQIANMTGFSRSTVHNYVSDVQ